MKPDDIDSKIVAMEPLKVAQDEGFTGTDVKVGVWVGEEEGGAR
jgi:hypothetical protein